VGQIKQALICGYGGQGIVLAGTILGQAAFNDGKWVGGTNSYGAASRGGACRAEVQTALTVLSRRIWDREDAPVALRDLEAFARDLDRIRRR